MKRTNNHLTWVNDGNKNFMIDDREYAVLVDAEENGFLKGKIYMGIQLPEGWKYGRIKKVKPVA